MNRYKILDKIRRTNIVGIHDFYLSILEDTRRRNKALKLQRDNLVSFLKRLRDNKYYSIFLKDISDEQIEQDPYGVLSIFPLADKSLLRDNFELIHNTKYDGENNYTGGSTGTPFHYICDKKLISTVTGFTLFSWSYFGNYNWNDDVIVVGGTSIGDKKSLKKRFLHYLQRRKFISGGEITKDNAKLLASYINNAVNPVILYGYPSSLCQYIELFKDEGYIIDTNKIKSVLVTSETLFDDKRKKLERYFNHNVVNLYGARDGGISAASIGGDFVYNGIDCFVENIDIDGVRELVITNLHSDAFPFVRYRIGDIGEVSIAPSPDYPFILKNIVGRTRDFITLKDGTKIHGSKINKIFSHYPIKEYQIRQKKDYSCNVFVSAEEPLDINMVISELNSLLRETDITIKIVDSIQRAMNAKLRNIISEIE